MTRYVFMSLLALLASGTLSAQSPSPTVHMHVTMPDGQATDVTAPESGLATVTLKDGASLGLRPTILDSRPWNRVVVTFFKMPTTTSAGEEIGTVEVRTGGPAVQAKISPALKVAVTSVTDTSAAPAITR